MSTNIHSKLRIATVFAMALTLLFGSQVAFAKNIKKQNFVDLLVHSQSILVGQVTKVTDGFQNNLPYTEVTIKVGQSIKGKHGEEYTFRQFGLMKPRKMSDGRYNLMVTPAGWPTFTKGETALFMLHKPAAKTGFQTLAGLTQGKFSIRGNSIENGIGNDQLFDSVKVEGNINSTFKGIIDQPAGAFSAEAFISLVNTAVSEEWLKNGVLSHAK